MEKAQYIVISYFPLLRPTAHILAHPDQQYSAGAAQTIAEEVTNALSQVPEIHVKACLWIQNKTEHTFYPVFLMDNAYEVMDHLVNWSEKNPAAWFSLYLEKIDDDRYCAMLFPNLDQSIARFKVACMQFGEFVPAADAHYSLLFKPLEFLSLASHTFNNVQQYLPNEMMVGFLNTTDFDQSAPEKCVDKIQHIGPIARITQTHKDNYITSYMDSRLKNLEEEEDERPDHTDQDHAHTD